jgi:predicted RNA methylase
MMAWAERKARRISKATGLLQPAVPVQDGVWADMGCGDGIFTSALYTLIRPAGVIYAVDRDPKVLEALARHFAESYPEAALHPICADFTRELKLPTLDGIVIARWVQRMHLTLWWTKRPWYPA